MAKGSENRIPDIRATFELLFSTDLKTLVQLFVYIEDNQDSEGRHQLFMEYCHEKDNDFWFGY